MDYEALRTIYRPSRITLLLIAESPPSSESNRFFYLDGLTQADSLFLETMRVCFPGTTSKLRTREIRIAKAGYLEAFREKGYYLIDATDTPIAGLGRSQKLSTLLLDVGSLQRKVRELIDVRVPIVLITATVWQIHSDLLKNRGYIVANDSSIPHPAFGHAKEFREKLSATLGLLGFV